MAAKSQSAEIADKPLTRAEIEAFVAEWYRKLDRHAPSEELLPLVAALGLEMQFPEGAIRGAEGFRQWYEGVIRIFFDELHTLTRVGIAWQDGYARVEVVVNWQARRWRAPSPRSEWLGFDACQEWEMVRSPTSGQPVIRRYIVKELRPMPGSKAL